MLTSASSVWLTRRVFGGDRRVFGGDRRVFGGDRRVGYWVI